MLGTIVTVTMDRPIGTVHPKHPDLIYPINYGYIEGLLGGDGEEQDVYILGVDSPLETFTGRIIAVIHRYDDVEEKWVAAPDGVLFTAEEIMEQIRFQEQYYHSEVVWLYTPEHTAMLESFHQMWDGFPGLARLIDKDHRILAVNAPAEEKGFLPGMFCSAVKTKENHKNCKLAQVIDSGKAMVDQPSPGKARGWMPVQGHPDVVVHFTLVMPEADFDKTTQEAAKCL